MWTHSSRMIRERDLMGQSVSSWCFECERSQCDHRTWNYAWIIHEHIVLMTNFNQNGKWDDHQQNEQAHAIGNGWVYALATQGGYHYSKTQCDGFRYLPIPLPAELETHRHPHPPSPPINGKRSVINHEVQDKKFCQPGLQVNILPAELQIKNVVPHYGWSTLGNSLVLTFTGRRYFLSHIVPDSILKVRIVYGRRLLYPKWTWNGLMLLKWA